MWDFSKVFKDYQKVQLQIAEVTTFSGTMSGDQDLCRGWDGHPNF